MADPATKIKFDQLKAVYEEMLGRLTAIQQELFNLGIEIETTRQRLADDGTLPKSFDDQIRNAKLGLKPKNIFGGPIKMRGRGVVGIAPHPVDATSVVDSDAGMSD